MMPKILLPTTPEEVLRRVETQAERRVLLRQQIRAAIEPCLARGDGPIRLDLGPHAGEARLTLWLARCFFAAGHSEDASLANDLIESVSLEDPQRHFNSHFCGYAALLILKAAPGVLKEKNAQKLEGYVTRYLSDWMTEDFRIHGANDNAGIECAAITLLAGERFGSEDLAEQGLARLEQFADVLELRGYVHECNSPTYSAVSLATLADLGEQTAQSSVREVALRLEQQVWGELLRHFHPQIGHQVGPFSRSFADDNACQCSLSLIALFCAFGEVSPFTPFTMLFPPLPGTFAHNSWLFQWASAAHISAPTYHPPLDLAAQCFGRDFPGSLMGSAEFSPMGLAPGGQTTVQAFFEEDWAMGCFGSRPLAGTAAHILYRRSERRDASVPEALAQMRSVFTRCLVSEKLANFYVRDAAEGLAQTASDQGAAFCVQDGGTLLLGYVPLAAPEAVRTIKSSVVFPLHFSAPDEVWHGETPVFGSASFASADWSFVRDGAIYLAVRPLLSRQTDQMFCRQQVERIGDYLLLSAYNLCDFSARTFTPEELRAYGGGFVIEIASARELASFAEFRRQIAQGIIGDRQWGGQRTLRYRRGERDLELSYDFRSLTLRRAAVSRTLVPMVSGIVTKGQK